MSNENSITDWPEADGFYKVVQLMIRNVPCIAFRKDGGLGGGAYHDDILRSILVKNEVINGEKWPPHLFGPEHKVVGMGFVRIESFSGKVIATFIGQSRGYKMGINAEHIEQMKEVTPNKWQLVCE